jgi:hypothetical protein
MPTEKNFKAQVRHRMQETGERYTTARAALATPTRVPPAREDPLLRSLEHDPGVAWLLASDEPAVRFRTLVDVFGLAPTDARVRREREAIPEGPVVQAILDAAHGPGRWGDGPAGRKHTGTIHVLKLLTELRVPDPDGRLHAALDEVLAWCAETRTAQARSVAGRVRYHAGRDGIALDAACHLDRAPDRRARALVQSLLETQWPDGGWNCDERPTATQSSFLETVDATRALFRFAEATADGEARRAAERSTEVFRRHLIRSPRTGNLISGRILQLHWPRGYDLLWGLEAIAPSGLDDPRLDEALDVLESKRRPDGTWRASGGRAPVNPTGGPGEVVDLSDLRHRMVTLRALHVLRLAGRLGADRATLRRAARVQPRRTHRQTVAALLADAGCEREVVHTSELPKDEEGRYERLTLDDGRRVIVRAYDTSHHTANKWLAREELAHRELGRLGLPLPRVLATITGSAAAGGDPAAMLVDDPGGDLLEHVLGHEAPGEASSPALWRAVGATMRRLHDLRPDDLGPLFTRPRPGARRWEGVAGLLRRCQRLPERNAGAAPAVAELRSLRRPIHRHLEALDTGPAPCFGDRHLYPTGLLVDRTAGRWTVRAWLGWGEYAVPGDPMADVVFLERKCFELTAALPARAFYDAVGLTPDPVQRLVFGFNPFSSPANVARWKARPRQPTVVGDDEVELLRQAVDEVRAIVS